MPPQIKTICSGCNRVIVPKGTKCAKCTEAYKARRRESYRDRPTDPFLSSVAWQKLRRAKMNSNPLCERCESRGDTTPAREVHHIEARQDAPDKALDWDNLMCVCSRCHRALTIQATRARKQM